MAKMKKISTVRRRRARLAGLMSGILLLAGLGFLGNTLLGKSPVAFSSSALEKNPLTLAKSPGTSNIAKVPGNDTMTLTIPKMKRVQNIQVVSAPADDEAALDRGAMHVQGTGFPWQKEANVYIAGHRLGYLGTGSFLVFYDLDKLQNGDEVILKDANGTRYTYKVFKQFIVNPDEFYVTKPMEGKNIVSLQTCTLPDYSQRIIVQAELTGVSS